MSAIAVNLILIFVAIAFAATIISGLIKLVFFFRQKDTYRHILKFGLLGEVIGLIIMSVVWAIFRKDLNSWQEPESILAIPFYLMLLGQLVGVLLIFRNRQRTKSALLDKP
jgi:amino acid transporter